MPVDHLGHDGVLEGGRQLLLPVHVDVDQALAEGPLPRDVDHAHAVLRGGGGEDDITVLRRRGYVWYQSLDANTSHCFLWSCGATFQRWRPPALKRDTRVARVISRLGGSPAKG